MSPNLHTPERDSFATLCELLVGKGLVTAEELISHFEQRAAAHLDSHRVDHNMHFRTLTEMLRARLQRR